MNGSCSKIGGPKGPLRTIGQGPAFCLGATLVAAWKAARQSFEVLGGFRSVMTNKAEPLPTSSVRACSVHFITCGWTLPRMSLR
jgi:hypothetical protein